jgi:hypothetical protein
MTTKTWLYSRWLDVRGHLGNHDRNRTQAALDSVLGDLPPDADDPPEVTEAREAWVNAQLALIAAYDRDDRLVITAARQAVDDTRTALEAAKARHGIVN